MDYMCRLESNKYFKFGYQKKLAGPAGAFNQGAVLWKPLSLGTWVLALIFLPTLHWCHCL
jgi:hypothetical protein